MTVYYSCAIFTCKCCNYQTEIYSNQEYLDVYIEPKESICPNPCIACGRPFMPSFDPGIIYRTDLNDISPLHPQCAELPTNKVACKECLNIDKMHWTELEAHCPKCNSSSMVFTYLTQGKHIQLFKKWAEEWAKPSAPELSYYLRDGTTYHGPFTDSKAN